MNIETERVIRSQLASGERLLWNGRPAQGIVFRTADAFMVPFSLLWGGFAFYWEYSAITMDKVPLFFIFWGIPFVTIGLHFIFGRFLVDAKQRANMSYGVTDQRVIIVSGILSKKIRSLVLRSLSDLSVDEKANGSGIISFGVSSLPTWWTSGMAWPGMQSQVPTFELTDHARTVYEMIRKAQESAI